MSVGTSELYDSSNAHNVVLPGSHVTRRGLEGLVQHHASSSRQYFVIVRQVAVVQGILHQTKSLAIDLLTSNEHRLVIVQSCKPDMS